MDGWMDDGLGGDVVNVNMWGQLSGSSSSSIASDGQ